MQFVNWCGHLQNMSIVKWAILCSDSILYILREYAPEEPSTVLVDEDAFYQWTKLSGYCICSKVCMLYFLVTGFAAHAATAIIRNLEWLIGTQVATLSCDYFY